MKIHEQSNKSFTFDPRFDYLPAGDRYLLDSGKRQHKLNVIGTGVIGQEHMLVTYLEGRAEILGIHDPNPGSVRAAQEIQKRFNPDKALHIYDSLHAACTDPDCDGLLICTPNYTHIDVVKTAVQSGKAILLEKPIATNLEDAFTIYEIANNYPALFQIGLQYRYKAIYQEAIFEALNRQTLGDIKTISMIEHRMPFLDKVGQWNKFSRYSGNTLVEKCCHYFDLLNLFAQAGPVSVYAVGNQAVNFQDFDYQGESSDILDNAFVIITYDNGVKARFDLCMFAPMIYEELIICGSQGHLKASENSDSLAHSDQRNRLEIKTGDHSPSRLTIPTYPSSIEHSGHSGATYYEHVSFIDNLEGNNSRSQPIAAATATEGLWSIIVAAAAQASIKSGDVVLINDFLHNQNLQV